MNIENNEVFSNPDTIGALLQTARNTRNLSLNEVASKLRIRQVYLEAIEKNQFSVLPGDIYVIGFIKSYSTYLGLDSEEIVERYKTEVVQVGTKTELKFPAYVPENGIPGGAVLLMGLIIAVMGYSGWYFLSIQNTFTTKQVANVPEALIDTVKNKSLTSDLPKEDKVIIEKKNKNIIIVEKNKSTGLDNIKSLNTLSEQNQSETTTANVLNRSSIELLSKQNETIPTEPAFSIPNESLSKENKPKPTIVTTTDPDTNTKSVTETDAGDVTIKEIKPPIKADVDSETTSDISVASKKISNSNLQEQPNSPNEVQLSAISPSRITLEALTDSYIQVRDNTINQLLITRLLKKGQRYMVPNRSGLTLITGNAGALKILVDGTEVPGIGPIGAIRRNVVLDATKLKNGLAVIE